MFGKKLSAVRVVRSFDSSERKIEYASRSRVLSVGKKVVKDRSRMLKKMKDM